VDGSNQVAAEFSWNIAPIPRPPKKKSPTVEICFMMDCTGSMGSWIQKAKDIINALAEQILYKFSSSVAMAFIGYRDFGDAEQHIFRPFTTDINALRTTLLPIKAEGGGDTPEDILGGFNNVLNLTWNAEVKILVHIADAPCHGKGYHQCDDNMGDIAYSSGKPEDLVKRIRDNNIDYYFIKINNSTDKMIEIFREAYDSEDRNLIVKDLGCNVEELMPTILDFVITSVKPYSKCIL